MSRSDDVAAALGRIADTPVSRRQFMGGVVSGALLLAVPLGAARAEAAGAGGAVGAWVLVGADESVTIIGPNSEMGQGTSSALPQILAEELMVDWSKVRMRLADANPAFANPLFRSQATGGSTAVRAYYEPLRRAGAQAREMLVAAAMRDTAIAGLGGGARADYVAEDGRVRNTRTGSVGTYGQLAGAAGTLAPPADPPLLAPASGRLIGRPLPRLDIPPKVDGSAVFGLDVRLPGMLYAAVRLAPKVGQTLGTVGSAPSGVRVVRLKDDAGRVVGVAAVTAGTTWDALRAVRRLSTAWVDAPHTAQTDTAAMRARAAALMTSGTPVVARSTGDAAAALAGAAERVTAEYSAPYLAHATMEPMNATAKVVPGTSCEVWAPTQNQSGCVAVARALTGLPEQAVKVHTTFLGGGLGRKYELDFVSQAVQVAAAVGGAPVKLVWSREEDFAHDLYRPASLCRMTGGLDAGGNPVALQSRSVSQSIYAWRGWLRPGAHDPSAVEGLLVGGGEEEVAYDVGAQRAEWVHDTTAKVPVGFWRSVGHSYNVFFLESFVDELAFAAGRDPLAFRKAMLPAGSRERAVLDRLEAESGWGERRSGVGRGVAITRCFGGTIVAQVADVTGSLAAGIRVRRISAVIDCGTVINPDTVAAQVEGAILQGVAAALWQEMPFTAGLPARRTFSSYRMGRLSDAPAIDVHVMDGQGRPPSGVGEPGLPPAAPAIGNAIAALTGTRLRALPFFGQRV